MARTTANLREQADPTPVSRYVYHGKGGCGFCTILTRKGVRHDLCPDAPDKKWRCQCALAGHEEGQ